VLVYVRGYTSAEGDEHMVLVQVKNNAGAAREYVAHKLIFDRDTGYVRILMPAYIISKADGHDRYTEHGVVGKNIPIKSIEWMSCDGV
jgi:hypothetical protein